MPIVILTDEDILKCISVNSGYSFGKIIKKEINEKGEVVVVVR